MNWQSEYKKLLAVLGVFLGCFFMPLNAPRFTNAVIEALALVKWYAQEHVVLCLLPAFFIAGAIAVFVSQTSVMKYLGAGANKVVAYTVASVSGSILAVCSCTILPLFAGIYRMGAGIGPATAFLYSGPAINVLAIILTARILGVQLGIARAIGAILFSIVIGLLMHIIFIKEEREKKTAQAAMEEPEVSRPLWQNAVYFALMVIILVFANWGKPDSSQGLWHTIYSFKWIITAMTSAVFAIVLSTWYEMKWWKTALAALPPIIFAFMFPHLPLLSFSAGIVGLTIITSNSDGEMKEWTAQSWELAKQILPLLLFGVIFAGILLGRPGSEGLIPSEWISSAVGGNSIGANLFASIAGAFMYFATLTEVPILQGLMANGMGKGPALALLLAGPALSLPNMLVIRSVMGTRKTAVFVSLVIVMAAISGIIYGNFF